MESKVCNDIFINVMTNKLTLNAYLKYLDSVLKTLGFIKEHSEAL